MYATGGEEKKLVMKNYNPKGVGILSKHLIEWELMRLRIQSSTTTPLIGQLITVKKGLDVLN